MNSLVISRAASPASRFLPASRKSFDPEEARAIGRLPLQARVGLNIGEVVVRSIATGEDLGIRPVLQHECTRWCRSVRSRQTEQVRKLCEGYFAFKSLGPTKVKGVSAAAVYIDILQPRHPGDVLSPLLSTGCRCQRAMAKYITCRAYPRLNTSG
jgi:hypothetical protein